MRFPTNTDTATMVSVFKFVSRLLAGIVLVPILALAVPLMFAYTATTWLAFKLGDWALLGSIEDD